MWSLTVAVAKELVRWYGKIWYAKCDTYRYTMGVRRAKGQVVPQCRESRSGIVVFSSGASPGVSQLLGTLWQRWLSYFMSRPPCSTASIPTCIVLAKWTDVEPHSTYSEVVLLSVISMDSWDSNESCRGPVRYNAAVPPCRNAPVSNAAILQYRNVLHERRVYMAAPHVVSRD